MGRKDSRWAPGRASRSPGPLRRSHSCGPRRRPSSRSSPGSSRSAASGRARLGNGEMRRLPHLSLTQVRLVRLFSLLLVFTVLVLYAVFRSSRFQELLRRRTERLLTAQIGRTVTIGSFDLALVPFAFLVRDLAVANDRRGLSGPAFSASEIELRGEAGNRKGREENKDALRASFTPETLRALPSRAT